MADFLSSIDIAALVSSILSNIVWIIVAITVFFALLLGIGLFKGRKRWLWRSILILVVCVVTLIFTNFQFFYNAYTEGDQLGDASRFQIGNTTPETAKSVEYLLIGVTDVNDWDGSGRFLSWEKEYSNDDGTAVMVKYLFHTTLEIETDEVIWRATCLFGKVTAEIEYKSASDSSS